jgi:hypothetical protein
MIQRTIVVPDTQLGGNRAEPVTAVSFSRSVREVEMITIGTYMILKSGLLTFSRQTVLEY